MISMYKPLCRLIYALVFFFTLSIAGCGTGPLTGLVFTKVKMPLSFDLNASPSQENNASGKIIKIKEPVTGYGIYTELNSNAIGDIAKKHNIRTIYFADKEVFSILGIWSATKVIIYGELDLFENTHN